jgi:hypothetical protein
MRRARGRPLTAAAGGPDKATPQLKFPITTRA